MRHILFDTDTASDDAVALVMSLRCADLHIEAVTCVCGNITLPKVIRSLSERVRASNVAQDGYLPEDLRNLFEFINLLNPEEAEALPDELIPQLQALASDFASATGFPVHAFRNVLLRRIRRSTPREESFV